MINPQVFIDGKTLPIQTKYILSKKFWKMIKINCFGFVWWKYGSSYKTLFFRERQLFIYWVISRHSCSFCSQQNPRWIGEVHTQQIQKATVWATIINNRKIGPFLFKENLTAERYFDFLSFKLKPATANIFSNEVDPDILFCISVLMSGNIWIKYLHTSGLVD